MVLRLVSVGPGGGAWLRFPLRSPKNSRPNLSLSQFTSTNTVCVIGASGQCDVRLALPNIQPLHAILDITKTGKLLLSVPTGGVVALNDQVIDSASGATEVRVGDELRVGGVRFVFASDATVPAPVAAPQAPIIEEPHPPTESEAVDDLLGRSFALGLGPGRRQSWAGPSALPGLADLHWSSLAPEPEGYIEDNYSFSDLEEESPAPQSAEANPADPSDPSHPIDSFASIDSNIIQPDPFKLDPGKQPTDWLIGGAEVAQEGSDASAKADLPDLSDDPLSYSYCDIPSDDDNEVSADRSLEEGGEEGGEEPEGGLDFADGAAAEAPHESLPSTLSLHTDESLPREGREEEEDAIGPEGGEGSAESAGSEEFLPSTSPNNLVDPLDELNYSYCDIPTDSEDEEDPSGAVDLE